MISKTYYTTDRLVMVYFGGKVQHYLRKDRIQVLEKTTYVVQEGDTMYTIAAALFGANGEQHWTIISDINYLRKPDELQVGETIYLPKVILNETISRLPRYEQNASTSTAV